MQKVILMVEDEPSNRRLFRELLESNGYFVIEAEEGSRAVELATQEKPDLILMDVGLPGMDGLEATAAIKSNALTSNIPVIALSGFAMDEDTRMAYDAGCDAYIAKPVDIRMLLIAVAYQLRRMQIVPPVGQMKKGDSQQCHPA